MTQRNVFTHALNELEMYMRWYYKKLGLSKEDCERMILDRHNLLIAMWLETEEKESQI